MQMLQMTLFPEPRRDYARRQRRQPEGRRQERPRHTDGRGHHADSLEAHARIEHTLTGRRAEVAAWVDLHGPCTDREIVEGLFFAGADMNLVRPRVTELLGSGDLAEAGQVRDAVTGMMVRRVVLVKTAGMENCQ